MAGNTKVLVIGATGYIGQHIAKAAASEPGVTAFALVSKATGERATAERAAAVEKLRGTQGLNVLEVTHHCALRNMISCDSV
jgi:nucleoside-diphosphate-sugar epimerase